MSVHTPRSPLARALGGISLGLALTLFGVSGTAAASTEKATTPAADKQRPATAESTAKRRPSPTSVKQREAGTPVRKADKAKSGGQAPAGNNGHIQIDELVMLGGNRNRPQVTCGLSVSFFGYDAGTQTASITMTPWNPTAGGTPLELQTSWTVASRTGGNQFDKNVPITGAQVAAAFQGVAPAKQGFHARIDVHVTGSQGADGKHKMVWIEPCADAPVAAAGSSVAGEVLSASSTAPDGARLAAAGWRTDERYRSAGGSVLSSGLVAGSVPSGVGVAAATAATALNLASTTTG